VVSAVYGRNFSDEDFRTSLPWDARRPAGNDAGLVQNDEEIQ
jgi:hypothetical protein